MKDVEMWASLFPHIKDWKFYSKFTELYMWYFRKSQQHKMTLLLESLLREHKIGKDLEKLFYEIKEGIDLEEIKQISIHLSNFWE